LRCESVGHAGGGDLIWINDDPGGGAHNRPTERKQAIGGCPGHLRSV